MTVAETVEEMHAVFQGVGGDAFPQRVSVPLWMEPDELQARVDPAPAEFRQCRDRQLRSLVRLGHANEEQARRSPLDRNSGVGRGQWCDPWTDYPDPVGRDGKSLDKVVRGCLRDRDNTASPTDELEGIDGRPGADVA